MPAVGNSGSDDRGLRAVCDAFTSRAARAASSEDSTQFWVERIGGQLIAGSVAPANGRRARSALTIDGAVGAVAYASGPRATELVATFARACQAVLDSGSSRMISASPEPSGHSLHDLANVFAAIQSSAEVLASRLERQGHGDDAALERILAACREGGAMIEGLRTTRAGTQAARRATLRGLIEEIAEGVSRGGSQLSPFVFQIAEGAGDDVLPDAGVNALLRIFLRGALDGAVEGESIQVRAGWEGDPSSGAGRFRCDVEYEAGVLAAQSEAQSQARLALMAARLDGEFSASLIGDSRVCATLRVPQKPQHEEATASAGARGS